MTLFFADLVREASWGAGTGDLPLGGALPGHRRFANAVPPGARFHYCIAGVTHPQEWETGEGEIGSADTLIRLPLASSAGGTAVAFSPGLKTVALTVNADWFAAREEGEAVDPAALAEALAAKADLAGAAFAGPLAAPALTPAAAPARPMPPARAQISASSSAPTFRRRTPGSPTLPRTFPPPPARSRRPALTASASSPSRPMARA